MEIKMARGDLEVRTFQVFYSDENGDLQPYVGFLNEIYLTVKRTDRDMDYLFQKRLGDGSISSLGDGIYQFSIEPEDTDNLPYGQYIFDIELVKFGEIKKTYVGTLEIMKEVTFASNEVTV